jgi:hypothetical protein
MTPPEMPQKICCDSVLDAACGWAKRMFHQGLLVRNGTSVLVRCANDPLLNRPTPGAPNRGAGRGAGGRDFGMSATTYQVKISIVNMPAFQASLEGVAYEGVNDEPSKGGPRG